MGLTEARRKAAQGGLGTLGWSAPEVFNCGRQTELTDAFAFGVILFECLSLSVPYASLAAEAIPFSVLRGRRPTDFQPLDLTGRLALEGVRQIMLSCWHDDQTSRPSFANILQGLQAVVSVLFLDFGLRADKLASDTSASLHSELWHDLVVFPNMTQRGIETDDKPDLTTERNDKLFNIDLECLLLGPIIGQGSYGQVFEGRYFGTPVAVKKMHQGALSQPAMKEFYKVPLEYLPAWRGTPLEKRAFLTKFLPLVMFPSGM